MRFFGLTLIAGLTLLLLLPATAQEVTVPRLTQYATDQTGTLSPDQLGVLNARLRTFEDSTSTQIVVLMLATLAGDPIDEFA
ncbi:MAG: TPM domain-containing protein, partial [Bacteroidota bacterium]